jgi:DNA-binding winged helix-turn-helix (wHTH) protein
LFIMGRAANSADVGHVVDRTFTPTQAKILSVLADGESHAREEIHACLPDDLGSLENIHAHISTIRKRLREQGQDIVCERVVRYRLVKVG